MYCTYCSYLAITYAPHAHMLICGRICLFVRMLICQYEYIVYIMEQRSKKVKTWAGCILLYIGIIYQMYICVIVEWGRVWKI